MGMLGKKQKKGHMLPFFVKDKTSATQNEDLSCYFQNSGIEQCCLVLFNLLCSLLMLISWTISSLYVLC